MSDDGLPAGWTRVGLSEVGEIRLGRQRSPKNHQGPNMRPYLRAANIGWSGLLLDDVKQMNFSAEEFATYELLDGDVLLSEGSGSVGQIGKPAVWRGQVPGCCFQNTLIRVRGYGVVDPDFLAHRLRLEALQGRWAAGFARGVGIHHLGSSRVAKWSIDLPPLREQARIVAELERRLSHVDVAIEDLLRAARRLRQARSAILRVAIPAELPAHWKAVTVADAGETRLGLQRSPGRHNGPEMRPYLRVANVFEDRIDLADVMLMNITSAERARYRLEPGDVLLNEGQSPEFLGRPALWNGQVDEMYFTNTLIRFRCRDDVLPQWALLVFRRHMHTGRFRKESRITTNIAHLALGRFRTVEFPIPRMEEQRAVVLETERRLSLLDAAERTMRESFAKARQLRIGLLEAAFAGRLVPQNALEEPARAAMQRPRASTHPTAGKGRHRREVPA